MFNQQGQYVAILNLAGGIRSEVAKKQWDDLRQIDSIDIVTGIPHPLQKRFVDPSKKVAPSVVELLVESQPVCFGIVVDADGIEWADEMGRSETANTVIVACEDGGGDCGSGSFSICACNVDDW